MTQISLLISLLAGVASSLIAIGLIESYHFSKKYIDHRALRALLGSSRRATIIVPIFEVPVQLDEEVVKSLTGTHDAYAIAHIVEAYRRIGVTSSFVSVGNLPEDLSGDVVAIGGHFTNKLTKYHMLRFFPGFTANWDDRPVTFRCGNQELVETEFTTWAFIARLTSDIAGSVGNILLLWSLTGVGTASAGYYAAQYPERLPRNRNRSFMVAVAVQLPLGYRAVSPMPIDLSDSAFDAQENHSRPGPKNGSFGTGFGMLCKTPHPHVTDLGPTYASGRVLHKPLGIGLL